MTARAVVAAAFGVVLLMKPLGLEGVELTRYTRT